MLFEVLVCSHFYIRFLLFWFSNLIMAIITSHNEINCSRRQLRWLPTFMNSQVASVGNWRGEYSYIVFYIINFFWNLLLLRSVNTNKWIFNPTIIDAGYATVYEYYININQYLRIWKIFKIYNCWYYIHGEINDVFCNMIG